MKKRKKYIEVVVLNEVLKARGFSIRLKRKEGQKKIYKIRNMDSTTSVGMTERGMREHNIGERDKLQ